MSSNELEKGGDPSSTQVQHPYRATVRTVFALVVALLSLLPVIAMTTGIDTVPAVAQILTVAALVTRVLALPQVDAFLKDFFPWLASAPSEEK